jgi:hypothetical protein
VRSRSRRSTNAGCQAISISATCFNGTDCPVV